MLFLNKIAPKTRLILKQARFFSAKSSGKSYIFEFENILSSEQQASIVETINESSIEKLSGYNIPLTHIKSIHQWKARNGPFTSIHEVLEVDGMGSKLLDKICNNIINNVQSNSKFNVLGNNKRHKHLVIPQLAESTSGAVQVIVAIHISLIGISWARISRNKNAVSSWSFQNYSSLPKKMTSIDTFNLAISTLKKIPPGDIYVFEQQDNNGGPQSVKQTAVYTQQNEMVSMLIALLNTSAHHNPTLRNHDMDATVTTIENRIYFLKPRLSARIFRTLVGNERVSAVNIISRLVKAEKLQLPCTPILTNQQVQSIFFAQSPTNKELLCQALMLAMCFMDLCIYKNPNSFEALRPKRNSCYNGSNF